MRDNEELKLRRYCSIYVLDIAESRSAERRVRGQLLPVGGRKGAAAMNYRWRLLPVVYIATGYNFTEDSRGGLFAMDHRESVDSSSLSYLLSST